MSVFQNALLTIVWLFTFIMCAGFWTGPAIETDSSFTEKLGETGLFILTAVIAHLIIKRILKSKTE